MSLIARIIKEIVTTELLFIWIFVVCMGVYGAYDLSTYNDGFVISLVPLVFFPLCYVTYVNSKP